ncbi:Acrosin [Lonchura striata]|uniref:Acrosin n=1 Tax=Lonchura striata TaxID=40157 RepID=A0A218UBK5_9PASE|nr:Acrosin [Lonchura striata domestica]
MALLGLLVLLALAGPVWTTWDTCRGTCGLRPLASDHSSSVLDYDSVTSAADLSRVVAGTGVQPGAWPGIVSIQATWENGTWHMCSGVLLSSQWVLTVAHCFARAGGISRWEVVMGVSDLSQPGPEAEVRHIQRLLVHQHYVPATARNDIALVELDRPVECSDYIQLGCVPDASIRVLELKSCYIAGWNFARGMVLRESKVHLIHTEICNSSRWYGGAVHADNLCAGYPQGGIDTCQGDSGNPLICKDNRADYYWLVGLNSWGRGCDRARRPGIYTSTQHFYNWILIQTGLSPADITDHDARAGTRARDKAKASARADTRAGARARASARAGASDRDDARADSRAGAGNKTNARADVSATAKPGAGAGAGTDPSASARADRRDSARGNDRTGDEANTRASTSANARAEASARANARAGARAITRASHPPGARASSANPGTGPGPAPGDLGVVPEPAAVL